MKEVNVMKEYLLQEDVKQSLPSGSLSEQDSQRRPLFNRKGPTYELQQEQPHHRVILDLLGQGFTVSEIARQTGFSVFAVSNVKRQNWAQPRILETMDMQRDSVIEALKANALSAVDTLISVHENTNSPAAVRVAAADKILDRVYGKPNQPITHGGSVDVNKLSDAELAAMLPQTTATATADRPS